MADGLWEGSGGAAIRKVQEMCCLNHAKNSPSKPAIIFRGRATTWGELDSRIDRLASGLVRRGVTPRRRKLKRCL